MASRLNLRSVEEHYAAMAKYLAVTAAVFFPFFAVNNFLQERDLIGYVSLAVILILALNAVLLRRVGYNPVRTFFFVVPALLAFIALVFKQQGVVAALWCTPALFAFYFILPERYAWLANALLIIVAILFAELTLEHNLALRVSATFTIAAILGGIFVRIIASQRALLEEQAVSDSLSGLKNRMLLDEALEQAISLYRAKLEGRNQVFSASIESSGLQVPTVEST